MKFWVTDLRTNKRKQTLLYALFLGGICLLGAFLTIINDTRVRIDEASISNGIVSYASIGYKKVAGVRYNRTLRVFKFKLINSDQNFTIYRSYEGYTDIEQQIHIGDTIRVYYRPSSAEFNLDVFQVEKAGTVLVHYKTYTEKANTVAGVSLIAGIFILSLGIGSYTKFNLPRFLNRLVQ